ncbi:hypothetical protein BRAS3843_460005 [Bradyrhizobium sp. STM 3843]|nr:hypothetical protein BRAS3843_460005 [Bradyrhizobium sp. STM 3843]
MGLRFVLINPCLHTRATAPSQSSHWASLGPGSAAQHSVLHRVRDTERVRSRKTAEYLSDGYLVPDAVRHKVTHRRAGTQTRLGAAGVSRCAAVSADDGGLRCANPPTNY